MALRGCLVSVFFFRSQWNLCCERVFSPVRCMFESGTIQWVRSKVAAFQRSMPTGGLAVVLASVVLENGALGGLGALAPSEEVLFVFVSVTCGPGRCGGSAPRGSA